MLYLVSLVFAILCMQSAPVLSAPQETTPASTTTTTLDPFTLPRITFPPLLNITFPPLLNITFPTLPTFPLLNLTLPTFTFPPFTLPTFPLNKRSISSTEASFTVIRSCKDNNGKVRVHESTWIESEDPCVIYACNEGLISTVTEICSIPLCQQPLSFPGECCPRCSHIKKK